MQDIPTWSPVVALALVRSDGAVLMHRRPPGKAHEGLWEFPGGKVERGEAPVIAAVRETFEELAVRLDPADLEPAAFAHAPVDGEAVPIVIFLYVCRIWGGDPEPQEGGTIGWFTAGEIDALEKPPLDIELARQLFAKRQW